MLSVPLPASRALISLSPGIAFGDAVAGSSVLASLLGAFSSDAIAVAPNGANSKPALSNTVVGRSKRTTTSLIVAARSDRRR
jgi:hypothetical protein